jgi:hypothetical protein
VENRTSLAVAALLVAIIAAYLAYRSVDNDCVLHNVPWGECFFGKPPLPVGEGRPPHATRSPSTPPTTAASETPQPSSTLPDPSLNSACQFTGQISETVLAIGGDIVGACKGNEHQLERGEREQLTENGVLRWRDRGDAIFSEMTSRVTWHQCGQAILVRPTESAFTCTDHSVILVDTFGGNSPRFIQQSSVPGVLYEYGPDGEYKISKEPEVVDSPTAYIEGVYKNVILSTKARFEKSEFMPEELGRTISLNCRHSNLDGVNLRVSYYRFSITIDLQGKGAFRLFKYTPDKKSQHIVNWTSSHEVRNGFRSNRMELRCIGPEISAWINGKKLATIVDGELPDGRTAIGMDRDEKGEFSSDVRFGSLVLLSP